MHNETMALVLKYVEPLADAPHPTSCTQWRFLSELAELFKTADLPITDARNYLWKLNNRLSQEKMRKRCATDDPRSTPFLYSQELRDLVAKLKAYILARVPALELEASRTD